MIRYIPFASMLTLASYPAGVSAISSAAKSAFDYAKAQNGLIDVSDAGEGVGKVMLTINENSKNIQTSNFDWRSGILRNVGDKRIAAVYLDLTDSVIPDIIFDGDGTGGDDVAKPLSHDWGTTETNPISTDSYQWEWQPARSGNGYDAGAAFDPDDLGNVNNLFVDELSDSGLGSGGGFRGGLILFKDFDAGEEYEFSSDTDSNAIAGLTQGTSNNHASWDVGGVSGAEMIGSEVSVLFGDGSAASGTIAADGSAAGGVAVVTDASTLSAPGLKVDTLSPGSAGNYVANPAVVVSGTQGDKVRVTRLSAFCPGDNQKALAGGAITAEALMTARLLAQSLHFPYTNAQDIQHVEVTLPASGSVDVTFKAGNEDVGAAYTAVVVDDDGLPLSGTSRPIFTSTPVAKKASGNLVANGSFESNKVEAESCTQYPEYEVEGWASVNADLEVCGTGFDGVEAYHGSSMLELDVNGGGAKDGIFQHLATEKGRLYKLSFYMMTTHRDFTHNHVKIEVSWRDQTIMNSYHPLTSHQWAEIVVIVEGSGGNDPLVIKERLASTGNRPLIDNVVMTPL